MEFNNTRPLGSMVGARLAAVLTSHASHHNALDAFTRGLGEDERTSLIGELRARSRCPRGSLVALLGVLLRAAPLRLQAARETLRLLRSEVISGKTGILCLSELRIAVLQHWECRCATMGDSDVQVAEPAEQRLCELLALCDDVLPVPIGECCEFGAAGLLRAIRPTAVLTASDDFEWGDGCTLAVQLLPTLLRAIDAVDAELAALRRSPSTGRSGMAEDGDAPSTRLLTWLLRVEWKPRCALALLNTIEDVAMLPAQRRTLREQLSKLLDRCAPASDGVSGATDACHADALAALRPHLLGIGRHVLAHAERCASMPAQPAARRAAVLQGTRPSEGAAAHNGADEGACWVDLILQLASVAPPAELAELLWLVEGAMRHSPALYQALHRALRLATERIDMGAGGGAATLHVTEQPRTSPSLAEPPTASGDSRAVDVLVRRFTSQLALFLLLLHRSALPPRLLQDMTALLVAMGNRLVRCSHAAAATPPRPRAHANGVAQPASVRTACPQAWAPLQAVLQGLVSAAALTSRTELLLDFARHLCGYTFGDWAAGGAMGFDFADGRAADREVFDSSCAAVGGASLMLALFGRVAEAQV